MSDAYETATDTETKFRPIDRTRYASSLTVREMEVLRLLAEGLSNQQIANKLYLSANTVRAHLYTIYNKLGVSTRVAAVHQALMWQLLRLDDLQ
jgi:DNA-binding CsgD family transcriptional regulator